MIIFNALYLYAFEYFVFFTMEAVIKLFSRAGQFKCSDLILIFLTFVIISGPHGRTDILIYVYTCI